MVGDGYKTYDHDKDGVDTMLGGCHAKIVNTEFPVRAKVIYAAQTLEVSVCFTSESWPNVFQVLLESNPAEGWTTCAKIPNVALPDTGYIGFTARTGAAHGKFAYLSARLTLFFSPTWHFKCHDSQDRKGT